LVSGSDIVDVADGETPTTTVAATPFAMVLAFAPIAMHWIVPLLG
jgi:hypothetical protein